MNRQLVIFLIFLSAVSTHLVGQVADVDPNSDWMKRRKMRSKELCSRSLPEIQEALDQIFNGSTYEASCRTRLVYLEDVMTCSKDEEVRQWAEEEMRANWGCMAPVQQFFYATYKGQLMYDRLVFDSALYYTKSASDIAFAAGDTSRFCIALSNLSAIFTEIRWYPEALSASIWARDLFHSSGDTNSTFYAYSTNNLFASYLDLGHIEQASDLVEGYRHSIMKYGNEELRQLFQVNMFRLYCETDPERALDMWERKLPELTLEHEAMFNYYLASTIGAQNERVSSKLLGRIVRLLSSDRLDHLDKLDYLIPSLAYFDVLPNSAKQPLMNLEPHVEGLRHMFARRDYYEVMANAFQSPEYWQKYRRAVNQTDSASQVYAIVFSDLLRTFNEDLAAESAVARKGSKLVTAGTALVVLSGILLVVLAGGFWYVSRIRKSALIQLRNVQASEEYREELKLKYELIVSEMASLLSAKGSSVPKSEIQKVVNQHVNQTTLDRDQMRRWMVEFELTRTEAEVLARIVLGQTNAELVSDLDLSKSYIHNVRSKLRHKLPLLEGEDLELFAQRLKTHDD